MPPGARRDLVPAKKTTRSKATTKSPAKKTTRKKTPAKKPVSARAVVPVASTAAKPGDVILLDSAQVGTPPREGEVLEVIQGEVRVSYLVRWPDGRQTLISPTGGTARFVRSSRRS
jgi:cell wall-associated NlpC family hydrolase